MNIYKVDITPYSVFKSLPSAYTIFGAISWAYRLLYGEENLTKLLNNFEQGNIPFLISSIFPKQDKNLLLPKPILKSIRKSTNQKIDFKKFKRINFIPIDLFTEILQGKIQDELELNLKLEEINLSTTKFATVDNIPHASIDRITGSTGEGGELYFEEIVAISEGYFFLAVESQEIKQKIESSLKVIEDIGLGGNRSIGFGKVKFGKLEEIKQLKEYFTNKTDRFITLSPVIPDNKINYKESFYDYFTFRGAVDNNYDFKGMDIWKNKVFYLKEGSQIKVKENSNYYGNLIKNQKAGKNIYQYGLAFPLYIQGGNK